MTLIRSNYKEHVENPSRHNHRFGTCMHMYTDLKLEPHESKQCNFQLQYTPPPLMAINSPAPGKKKKRGGCTLLVYSCVCLVYFRVSLG